MREFRQQTALVSFFRRHPKRTLFFALIVFLSSIFVFVLLKTKFLADEVVVACNSIADGNWSDISIWENCPSGTPLEGNDAYINNNIILDDSINLGAGNLFISSGGSLDCLEEDTGLTLAVNNLNIDYNGTLLVKDITIRIARSLENSGSIPNSDTLGLVFTSPESGQTLKTNNASFNSISFDGLGSWALVDDLLSTDFVEIKRGSLFGDSYILEADRLVLSGGDYMGGIGWLISASGIEIVDQNSNFIAPVWVLTQNFLHSAGTTDWQTYQSLLEYNLYENKVIYPENYYNVILRGTDLEAVLSDDTTIINNISIQGIKLSMGDKNLNIEGDIVATNSAALTMTTGVVEVGGDLKFRDGTLTSGAGSIILTGSDEATVTGNNTFNNLKIDTQSFGGKTVLFEAGSTQTINGLLELDGSDGNVLTLDGAPKVGVENLIWNLAIQKDTIVGDYINVSNCNLINYKIIAGENSIDVGGNTGWEYGYPVVPVTPTPSPTVNPTPSLTPTPTFAPSPTPSSTPSPIISPAPSNSELSPTTRLNNNNVSSTDQTSTQVIDHNNETSPTASPSVLSQGNQEPDITSDQQTEAKREIAVNSKEENQKKNSNNNYIYLSILGLVAILSGVIFFIVKRRAQKESTQGIV